MEAAISATDDTQLHGDCLAPVVRLVRGVESELLHRLRQWETDESIDYAPGHGHLGGYSPTRKLSAYLSVRCRKCETCLRQRGKLWMARGADELKVSRRSWFGTLTLSPEQQFRFRCMADRTVSTARCEPWSSLSSAEQFKAIVSEISPEITKWLKRVRQQAGVPLRYLLVSEAHKSGLPHFHILVHEPTTGRVTERILREQWRLGFSRWKLVDNPQDSKAAFYVCKYLTKSALTRVRASARYGQTEGRLTELVDIATRTIVRRKTRLYEKVPSTSGSNALRC